MVYLFMGFVILGFEIFSTGNNVRKRGVTYTRGTVKLIERK